MQHYLLCRKQDALFAHVIKCLTVIGLQKSLQVCCTVRPHSQFRLQVIFGQNYSKKQSGIHRLSLVNTEGWLSLRPQTFTLCGFCSLFPQMNFPLRSNEWQCYMTAMCLLLFQINLRWNHAHFLMTKASMSAFPWKYDSYSSFARRGRDSHLFLEKVQDGCIVYVNSSTPPSPVSIKNNDFDSTGKPLLHEW